MSTPHARGSTRVCQGGLRRRIVYPACAGIHLGSTNNSNIIESLPRMRGDPPCSPLEFVATISSTPHARGSTQIEQILEHIYPVYPACAGIHLLVVDTLFSGGRLPRMRGDPPLFTIMVTSFLKSTPNARGSTNHCWRQSETNPVYPACAGIHPHTAPSATVKTSLPRMRGDPPFTQKACVIV